MVKIGLTISVEKRNNPEEYCIPADYITAVMKYGASPVLIPPLDEHAKLDAYLEDIDGLVLTGGDDISPELYGEVNSGLTGHVSKTRDEAELYIIGRAVHSGIPLLGICRGFQILNVYFGGTLYQDLASQFGELIHHANPFVSATDLHHDIFFECGTAFMGISGGADMTVNSRHHQGIKALGTGLRAGAFPSDGLIEAFECSDMNIMAVQWHPENTVRLGGRYDMLFQNLLERSTIFAGKK